MDPLYELATKLLQKLDPEWGVPPPGRARTRPFDWARTRLAGVTWLPAPVMTFLSRFRSLRRSVVVREVALAPPSEPPRPVDDPTALAARVALGPRACAAARRPRVLGGRHPQCDVRPRGAAGAFAVRSAAPLRLHLHGRVA